MKQNIFNLNPHELKNYKKSSNIKKYAHRPLAKINNIGGGCLTLFNPNPSYCSSLSSFFHHLPAIIRNNHRHIFNLSALFFTDIISKCHRTLFLFPTTITTRFCLKHRLLQPKHVRYMPFRYTDTDTDSETYKLFI